MNTLIINAQIVTSSKTESAEILITGTKIARIEEHIESIEVIDETIDAKGLIVLPGGVDPHVHLHLPTPAGYSADDFRSGSEAALLGGTTTIIDFVTSHKGQSLVDALDERIDEASNTLTDFTFHISPVEWRNTTEKEIVSCIERGFTSFKVYMAYKDSVGLNDEALLRVMQVVGSAGGIVAIHCESGDDIERLRNELFRQDKVTPAFHALSRPPKTESKAVRKAIELAAKAVCPLYIVHVSTAESLQHIHRAQLNGQKVYAETCPHYLLLNDSSYQGDFEQTVPFVMSPPLRKKSDNEALWEAIHSKVVQTVGTDHCPFTMEQKAMGRYDFRKIPNGVPGIGYRLNLLYSYGVLLRNDFNINQLENVFASNPAKIFGFYPQKGAIAIGSDADLVLYNPHVSEQDVSTIVSSKFGTDIYKSMKTKGNPEMVLFQGEIVVRKGILVKQPQGKLIRRLKS
ncbi:MAG: dihydropyrimidinase [Bacteroidales bacterium]|nr:dihydropyrimidinase [Bacteroidales bacterium]